MLHQLHFHLSLLLFTLLFTATLAQSPAQSPTLLPAQSPVVLPAQSPPPVVLPAQSPPPVVLPAPSGSVDITQILQKAGQYTMLLRLLKRTQTDDRINNQLSTTSQGLTLFAPTDSAFSNLKSGTLNSLSDEQKLELVQFHILSSYIPISQFQTVSNPLNTRAGSSEDGQYPLNVTTSGNNVNISTGVVSASIDNTVYSDGQLAVYQVDQVLLPMAIFGPSRPALAPTKPLKEASSASPKSSPSRPSRTEASVDASDAMSLTRHIVVSFGVAGIAAFCL